MKINVKIPRKINIGEIKTGTPPYKLPIASKDTLGGIKVGQNLTIDEDGTLNAKASESVDLTEYAKKSEVPTKTSQLENDSNFINSIKTINGQTLIGEGNITIKGGDAGTGSGGSLEIETITIPLSEPTNEDGFVIKDFLTVRKCGNICALEFNGGDGLYLENNVSKVIAVAPEGYRPISPTIISHGFYYDWRWDNYYDVRLSINTAGEIKLIQNNGTKVKITAVYGQLVYFVDEPMPIIGENVDISKYATIEDMENTINEAIGVALEGEY